MRLTLILVGALLAACRGPKEEPTPNVIDAAVCASSHAGTTRDLAPGTTVQICDQFYESAPRVRIVEGDDFSDPSRVAFYGAIDSLSPAAGTLSDRTGQKYLVLNKAGQLNPTYDYSAFPSTMLMPSNLYLYLVYKIEGRIAPIPSSASGAPQGAKGIILDSAVPVLYIPGSLIDSSFLGTWEGWINTRIDPAPNAPNPTTLFFDSNSPTPIRMTFTGQKPLPEPQASGVTMVWPDAAHEHEKLLDVSVSDLVGTVDNFQSDVAGEGGSCVKSLAGLDKRNPFLGATSGAIEFYRFPGMHGAGSEADVMVFPADVQGAYPNGMSVPFFMKASTLLLSHSESAVNEFPHGIHNGFEIGGLHKVSGGGGSCP